MIESIDPATFWGATGAASLALYIIWDKAAHNKELKGEIEKAQDRERATQLKLAEQTVSTTNTLREMTAILSRNDAEHRLIQDSLQVIINKCERHAFNES